MGVAGRGEKHNGEHMLFCVTAARGNKRRQRAKKEKPETRNACEGETGGKKDTKQKKNKTKSGADGRRPRFTSRI